MLKQGSDFLFEITEVEITRSTVIIIIIKKTILHYILLCGEIARKPKFHPLCLSSLKLYTYVFLSAGYISLRVIIMFSSFIFLLSGIFYNLLF